MQIGIRTLWPTSLGYENRADVSFAEDIMIGEKIYFVMRDTDATTIQNSNIMR